MNTTIHPKKTHVHLLGAMFIFLALFAAPATFAATITWNAASGSDIGLPANWTGGVLPSAATPDNALWNNTPSGALSLAYNTNTLGGAAGNAGINLILAAANTGSLTIDTGTNTSPLRLGSINITNGAGALTLGDGSDTFNITLGGAAGTQGFTNNSANTMTVNSDVVFGLGGGGTHTLALDGSGNFILNSVLGNGTGTLGITKTGAGTATLAGANTYSGTTTVGGGTLAFTGAAKSTTGTITMNGGILDLSADLGINNATLVNGTGGTINATGGGKILLNVAGGDFGVANGGTITCNAVIANGSQSSIDFWNTSSGTGIVALTADNTFDGTLNLQSGVISVANVRNTGVAGNLGKSGTINIGATTSASTLKYTGTGETSDKVINLAGTTGGATIDQSGTGLLKFTANTTATGAGAKTLTLQGSTTGTGEIAGNIVDNTGANRTALTKAGTGKWTISGTFSTNSGATTVSAGTLAIAAVGGNTNTTATLTVGNTAGASATLNVLPAAIYTNYNLSIGANATAPGAVYQTGGTFILAQAANTGNFPVGAVISGYGYYNLSGGNLSVNEAGIGGAFNAATGVMDISGGTFTDTGYLTIARGGTTCSGVLNVIGGTVNYCTTAGTGPLSLNYGGTSGATAVLNVGGGGSVAAVTGAGGTTASGSFTGKGLNLIANNVAGTIGVANLLNNGTLTVSDVTAGGGANPTAVLNFNGGTLKATASNLGASFMTSGNIDGVYVYPNGGTVDNNGTSITISRPLLAPTSTGVSSITGPSTQGSGYVGAPMVTITGGTAIAPATAYAVMADDGTGAGTYKVSSIVVSSPGVYTATPTTVTLTGGGGTAASGFTINTAANASGGMTFKGSGTTTVFPGSTYTGGALITNCTVNADANNTTSSDQFGTGTVAVNGDGTNGKVVLGTGSVTGVNNSTVTRANNFALTNAFLYAQDQRQALSGTVAVGGLGATLGSTFNNAGAEADKGLILSGAVSGSGPITIQHTRIGTGQPYNASFVAFNNNANSYSGTVTINENTTSSEGGVYLALYQSSALANAAVVANSDVPGSSLKFGNSPIVFNTGLGSATIGSLAGAAKVVLTGYNTTNHVYGTDAIALTLGGNNASTTNSGVISGAGSLTKSGTGSLTLSGANTYTGNTTISNGRLALSGSGSLLSSNIIINGSTIFDVSAISYTMAASQSLLGSGVVTGAVTTANSTSAIKPASVGVAGTLSLSNNLTMTSGGSTYFDLSTSASSGNDQIVVGGNLALSSADTIHISALSGAANLDTNADYVLFSVAGTTTLSSTPVLAWDGTPPANYLNYSIQQVGQNVVLHYVSATAPTLTAIASPATSVRNQAVTITATVTPGNPGLVTNVQINVSAIGGSAAAPLVLSGTPNVYTNTFVVASSIAPGVKLMPIVATDNTPLSSPAYTVTNTVVVTNEVWSGAGSDDNWSTSPNWNTAVPGTSGDSVTFAGTTRLTPNMDASYSVTGLTFNSNAGNFNIGTTNGSTLTLAGGVTNNSANAQTLNVPITMSGAATLNATNGNLTLGQTLASGGNTLTVAGSANTTIGNVVSGNGSLFKQGTGTLTISSNSVWAGTGATSGGFSGPLIAQAGNTIFNNGSSNFVNGELVIGGVIANGGAGNNAKITVDNAILNLANWFSVGRGNGVSGVSSDLLLTNGAVVSAPNMSCGFNGGNAANLPKGSVTLNNSSTFTVTGNGAVNFAESAGSDMTLTLNNSAQFIALGTAQKHLGEFGNGTVNLNDSSLLNFGNGTVNIGYRSGTGVVNVASSAVLNNAGELRVGGSDTSGTGNNGYGTLNMNGGSVNLGSLTLARGNNNQNGVSGEVNVNSGTLTSTNDVTLGFAGTGRGKLNVNGGTVNVGTTVGKWLIIPQYDTTTGELDITNGALNLNSQSSIKFSIGNTGTAGSPNVINQAGGSVNFYNDFAATIGGGGVLDLQYSGAATITNIYNLNGGTLTVPQIVSTLTTATRIFNFNGGTLKAAASSPAFMNLGTGNAVANVRNGGAIIDTDSKSITIGQALVHSTVAGDTATDGGLTKNSNGTLILTNANTYTGNTTVNAGTLALSGSGAIANTANIVVAGGATFDVSGLSSSFGLGVSQTLSNSASATGTLNGNLNTGSGAVALSYISGTPAFTVTGGTLTLSAGTVLNLNNTGAQLGAGSYKIISAGAGGSVAGTVPSSVAVGGNGVVAGGVSSLAISSGELYLVVTVTVNTSTTLGIVANPSTYGQAVTFTASVSPVPAGGTVQFYDNGVALDVPQNVDTGNGQAQLVLSTLAAGNHPITATYSGFGVYTIYTSSGSSVSNLVVNTQTPLVESLPTASSISYGQTLAGSSLNGGAVTNAAGTTVAGAFTFADAAIVPNAGSTNVLVIFTPTDSVDYNQLTNTVAVSVSQASLTITANSTNKVYGQTVTLVGTEFTTSGLTNGDSVTSVTLTSDGAVNTATLGSYPITASAATGTGLGNYNISYVAGSLTVNPLVAALAGTRAYDGTTNAAAADLAVTNVVNGDVVTLTGTGGLAGANVGTNAITSFGDLALSGGAGTNYTLVGATGSMVITNTPLLITANNDSKTYDGVPYSGGNGVTYAGFVNGETNTDLAGALSYTGTAQTATTVGGYDITPTGYTSTNYLISYVSGTLTINQATSVINTAPTASAITYGQTLGDSILSGGSATPTGGSFAFTSPATVPPVGTAAYGVTYTPVDTVNYTTATTSVNVTVNPACTAPTIVGGIDPGSLTVTAFSPVVLTLTNATGTAPFAYQWLSNSVAITGATNSSYTNLSVTVADAGSYQVVVANDCGAITSSVAILTVNPQTPLIATAPTATTTITYGQALSAAGLTGGSVTNAAGAAVTGTFAYTTPAATPNAGTAAQDVTFTPDDAANYTTATTTVSVTVDKATPTATLAVNNSPVTYTGLGQAATVSVTASNTPGAVANILTGGAASQSNAGTYAVTADYVPDDTANYNTLTAVAVGNFIIQPAPASVTADAKSKTYGDVNPGLTATVLGTVNGDVLNYTLATDATQFSSVGVSNITVSLGSNPNYAVLTTNSTLTISAKAASVTADAKSKTYGDMNPALTATDAGTVNGDVLNYTLATEATQFSSVGVSNITVTLGSNPNYAVLATNSTLTIGTKTASVTANSTSKIYGQTVTFAGTEFSTIGFVGGDAVTSVTLSSTGAVNTAAVNTYPITASAAVGNGLGNYTISYVDGTLTVTAGTPLTINAPIVLPDGNVQLTFTGGDAGVSYQIQASTNLTGAVWDSLITNTASISGLSSYTDLNATNHVIRFYRTVTP